MPSTQKCIVASFALIVGVGLGVILAKVVSLENLPTDEDFIPTIAYVPDSGEFKAALLPLLETRFGSSTVGFEPQKIVYTYPGISLQDFNGVEANGGTYVFRNDFLWYEGDDSDDAMNDLSDDGFVTLHKNIQARLGNVSHVSSSRLVALLEEIPMTEEPVSETDVPLPTDGDAPVESPEEPTVCPMDARMCPDGTFVGRTAPGCAFAECPTGTPPSGNEIMCTPEQREAEACIEIYAPVCAAVEVQCITTPCNPVPQTYSNSCFACAEDRVISYTEGECSVPTE